LEKERRGESENFHWEIITLCSRIKSQIETFDIKFGGKQVSSSSLTDQGEQSLDLKEKFMTILRKVGNY